MLNLTRACVLRGAGLPIFAVRATPHPPSRPEEGWGRARARVLNDPAERNVTSGAWHMRKDMRALVHRADIQVQVQV
jgi:hypothetical protein